MEPQNIERRDSKKSTKNGSSSVNTGGNKSQNRGGSSNNGGKATGGEKQRSYSQKSAKPYREIYKPPSLRSTKNRSSFSEQQEKSRQPDDKSSSVGNQSLSKKGISNNTHYSKHAGNHNEGGSSQQNGGFGDTNGDSMQNGYSLFGNNNGNSSNESNGTGSVPSSPLISNRMQQNAFNIGLAKRMLNVNAKEFQFLPLQQQHQQQQISNFLSQFDPSLFYNGNSPILASTGCYPLKQSKSSGNMNLLLQQQQQQQQQQAQAAALQQLQQQLGFSFPMQANFSPPSTAGNNNGSNQFNRLSQSKSSGNVPGSGNKPRVRFDDEEPDIDDVDDFVGEQLGNYLTSLKLNGDVNGISSGTHFPMGYSYQQQQQQQQHKQSNFPLSPQPVMKSSLQKSRTGFYLNLYGNQQQQQQQMHQQNSPTKSIYGYSPNSGNNLHHGANYASGGLFSGQHSFTGTNNVVKRSRSFGPGTHHAPRTSATNLLSSTSQGPSTSSIGHSVYSDFCISKWPRLVQELVTAAVTGVDRIPARNWIEMVNGIFEAMLCDYRSTKGDRRFSSNKSFGGNKMSKAASALPFVNNDRDSKEMSTAAGETLGKSEQKPLNSAYSASSPQRESNDLNFSPDVNDNEDDEDDEDDDDDDTDLASAAVHIFLYFIQREKDRTVMESLLNTCFASFQRLSTMSVPTNSVPGNKSGKSHQQKILAQQIGKPSVPRQWSNFLRFLSSLYSQVKLIRRQKQSQQQPGQSMDEMGFSLLALLCDSCLATLRSPQSYTAEMMGCLFTVLTSIGRDMEGTFPLKMKQLLAAVRDALLGIGPYHQHQQHHYTNSSSTASSTSSTRSSSLSPIVQKTLMQLIELHAANWQLPASAVRYYYSSVGSGNNGKSIISSSSNSNNTTSSSPGNSITQKSIPEKNDNSMPVSASTSHSALASVTNASMSSPTNQICGEEKDDKNKCKDHEDIVKCNNREEKVNECEIHSGENHSSTEQNETKTVS